jgi:hypothetical protein
MIRLIAILILVGGCHLPMGCQHSGGGGRYVVTPARYLALVDAAQAYVADRSGVDLSDNPMRATIEPGRDWPVVVGGCQLSTFRDSGASGYWSPGRIRLSAASNGDVYAGAAAHEWAHEAAYERYGGNGELPTQWKGWVWQWHP